MNLFEKIVGAVNKEYDRRVKRASEVIEYGMSHHVHGHGHSHGHSHGHGHHEEDHEKDHEEEEEDDGSVISNVALGTHIPQSPRPGAQAAATTTTSTAPHTAQPAASAGDSGHNPGNTGNTGDADSGDDATIASVPRGSQARPSAAGTGQHRGGTPIGSDNERDKSNTDDADDDADDAADDAADDGALISNVVPGSRLSQTSRSNLSEKEPQS